MKRTTRAVRCGSVTIGGGHPVSIQSMTNTDTRNVEATLEQIYALAECGCEIVRVAIPDREAAQALAFIKKESPLPVVADIHFDYRLALLAMENGADKIRINPGNIGGRERLKEVYMKAAACRIPVRIGVNAGSLEKDLIERFGAPCAEAMCESACRAVAFAQDVGFYDLVVSIKSSDVRMNHRAHLLFAAENDIPLHIGLTEAGIGEPARVKSAVALGALLLAGIGDTMRISLTGDPVSEVVLAKQVLAAAGVRQTGIDFISCPTCGRTRVDLQAVAERISRELAPLSEVLAAQGSLLRVAVMGCEVNGPGEAAGADIGVACGKGQGLIFLKGQPLKTVPESEIVPELTRLIQKIELAK